MPIKVSCHCGANFSAKDELAGQTLLCPKCSQPLTIGEDQEQTRKSGGGGMSELFDEIGLAEVKGPRCPQCAGPVQQGAILCVNCGYNLQTGEKVEGVQLGSKGPGGHTEAADVLLDRAAARIAEDKAEERKTRAQGAPAWVYFIAFAGVVAFAICMFVLPRDVAFRVNGTGVIIFGGVMIGIYGIRMIVVAFLEDVICGLLWLFVPGYSFYYLITRWKQVGGFFIMQMVGTAVIGLGCGMIYISPWMAMKKDGEVRVPPPAPRAVAACRLTAGSGLSPIGAKSSS